MKSYFITLRSLTDAHRGQQAFQEEGLECTLRRTNRWMQQRGCGYGLAVKLIGIAQGLDILRRKGIPYRRAYRLYPDHVVEEVAYGLS